MSSIETKLTVFDGPLQPCAARLDDHVSVSSAGPIEAMTRYWILSQSMAELRDPENSPSVSMWTFLLASAQTQHLNKISIYVQRGTDSEQMRLLYMNDCALTIWKEMQKSVTLRGRLQKPPRTAVLSFGMPFANS